MEGEISIFEAMGMTRAEISREKKGQAQIQTRNYFYSINLDVMLSSGIFGMMHL